MFLSLICKRHSFAHLTQIAWQASAGVNTIYSGSSAGRRTFISILAMQIPGNLGLLSQRSHCLGPFTADSCVLNQVISSPPRRLLKERSESALPMILHPALGIGRSQALSRVNVTAGIGRVLGARAKSDDCFVPISSSPSSQCEKSNKPH